MFFLGSNVEKSGCIIVDFNRFAKITIVNLFNQAESKADKIVRLSDENIFQVSIGKRVLKNEFVENGKIPVYSANVIEPFGSIDKLLIDFSRVNS